MGLLVEIFLTTQTNLQGYMHIVTDIAIFY